MAIREPWQTVVIIYIAILRFTLTLLTCQSTTCPSATAAAIATAPRCCFLVILYLFQGSAGRRKNCLPNPFLYYFNSFGGNVCFHCRVTCWQMPATKPVPAPEQIFRRRNTSSSAGTNLPAPEQIFHRRRNKSSARTILPATEQVFRRRNRSSGAGTDLRAPEQIFREKPNEIKAAHAN